MPPRRRLNLFAFPPETNALFGMLIVSAIMLALFLGRAFGILFGFRASLSSLDFTTQRLEVARVYLPLICLSGSAVLIVLAVATFFYLRHPSEIRRRRQIAPLSEKDKEIQEYVNKLALKLNIQSPTVEMPPRSLRGTDAQAFGIGKSQTIALDGGLRILRKTKPDVFNALLHHELAHFVNNDIGRSYFSDALWRSIRGMIVLPFFLGVIGLLIIRLLLGIFYGDLFQRFVGVPQVVFGLFVQFSFVLAIAALIWARLLRTREFYADWRATCEGCQGGLQQIFQEEMGKKQSKTNFNLWKLHPDAKERMDVIEHPEILFRFSPVLVFLTGLLLSFMLVGLYFSFSTFLAFAAAILNIRDSTNGLSYWLATGVFWLGFAFLILTVIGLVGWLINGVLLPQIQKQTILELLKKESQIQYLKVFIASLILIAGIEFGFFMTPFGTFAPKELRGIVFEFFIFVPMLIVISCWYLYYIRFVTLRLSALQIGRIFSGWKSKFIEIVSGLWVFLFLLPGVLLSRFVGGEIFLVDSIYLNLGWLAFTLLLSPIAFGATWILIKLLFDNQPKKCPHCEKITRHPAPAIELCEHCGGVLGEWLFVPESP